MDINLKVGDIVESKKEFSWFNRGTRGEIVDGFICQHEGCKCQSGGHINNLYLVKVEQDGTTVHIGKVFFEVADIVRIRSKKYCNCLSCFDEHTSVCLAQNV